MGPMVQEQRVRAALVSGLTSGIDVTRSTAVRAVSTGGGGGKVLENCAIKTAASRRLTSSDVTTGSSHGCSFSCAPAAQAPSREPLRIAAHATTLVRSNRARRESVVTGQPAIEFRNREAMQSAARRTLPNSGH